MTPVAVAVKAAPDPGQSPTIAERVMAEIKRGMDNKLTINEAVAATLGWIKRKGLAEEVLTEFGPRMLADRWGLWAHSQRYTAIHGVSPEPGERRVNASLMNTERSLYETLWPMGDGRWKKLGDFTRLDCRRIREESEKLAAAITMKGRAFGILERKLSRNATVQQKIGHEALRTILQGVERDE